MIFQKIVCIYFEYFGWLYGKICVVFLNSLVEISMFFNLMIFNRIGELKMQWYKNFIEYVNCLIVKFYNIVFFEFWMSYINFIELRSIYFNIIVLNRFVDIIFYFCNCIVKVIGFNVIVMKK